MNPIKPGLEWRIYYSDKTIFDSLMGTWEEAPTYGVCCVATIDPTGAWGRFVLHNHEFYYKIPGREVMCSEDLALIKRHVPDIQARQIKRGGNAWQDDWNEIQRAAGHDPDFPTRSPRRRVTDWRRETP